MNYLTKIPGLLVVLGLLALLALLALTACGGGAAAKPTVDAGPIYTEIASTAMALQTQTVQAQPTASNTPPASATPQVTNTLLLTDTPLAGTPASGTPSVTPQTQTTPKSTLKASCDNMKYVADVTYPDGEIVHPGKNMVKTWTVKNAGPCAWTKSYGLVFGWGGVGTDWNTAGFINLTKDVKVGETIDISVSLEAPTTKGTYGAYFVMQNDKGVNFPSSPLTIFITVQ